jgi:hypothetical protein
MLPENATARSHELLKIAQTVVASCPANLADAIVVTGSVSRGKADQFSDVDILFWLDTYPAMSACRDWIESHAVSELRPAVRLDDGSLWFEYAYQGYPVNLMWETWAYIERKMQVVRDLTAGKILLPVGEVGSFHRVVQDAVPLRDHPLLKPLQAEVRTYPDRLRQRLIEDTVDIWRRMMQVPMTFAGYNLVPRGEIIDLKRRQMMSVQSILMILFAYNRRWLPDGKSLISDCELLPMRPDHLQNRIQQILANSDVVASIRATFALKLDVLHLVQDEFRVDDLFEPLQAIHDYDLYRHQVERQTQ